LHDLSLDDDIRYLKGVGEKRAELFYKLGVSTVGALLRFYPRKYADYSRIVPVSDASIGDSCTVKVTIGRRYTPVRTRSGRTMFRLEAYDDSDAIEIVFFNNRFGPQGLETGSEAVLYGRISGTMLRKQIINPIKVKDWEKSGLVPQYPQTAGLSSTYIAKTVRTALSTYGSQIRETLPSYILDEYMLEDLPGSIRNIHFPADAAAADLARRRLIFEELLVLQLGMSLLKRGNRSRNAPAFRDTDWKSFAGALPFELTNAQKRSIAEVAADLSRNEPMARLIQGDVGSGKTVVAAAAAFLARANGYQCAVMAPTELLAKQHAETFQNLLGQFGVNIALLTGSVKGKKRDVLLENLRNGSVDLLVGTHALISDEVEFSDLGVVVVDEQHRFGVEQRSRLGEKGMHPHVLVMSATPIPRTLALMIYGDLDVSIIDEMPPGRKPVKTYFVNSSMRSRYLGFVRKQADEGHQSYIVCPLVEESEALEGTLSATEYFEELKNGPLSSLRLGLIHGRMKPEAKEKVMGRFVSGELDVLVSTTVIGVGVDNPRATLMLIENAERFGLSDLHQLRGRVGRGDSQSYCVLVSDAKDGPAAERLKMLTKTSSGFEVAKYDLATRGPGDFLGKRQHGLPELAIADLVSDEQPLYNSQKAAESILKNDPDLAGPEHEGLRKEVADMFRSKETAMN
jgi:ATP-dependent DNA helicase RecG